MANKFIHTWGQRAISFLQHPQAMLLRRKGVISDIFIKLDQPWIHDLGIKTVLDIGGNVGRFSKTMEYLFPDAKVIAFEPLPSCYDEMLSLMEGSQNFKAYNIGLGETDAEMEMEESNHNPSSSLLPMADLHKNAFPKAAGGKKRLVKVKKLDDLIDELNLSKSIMIKVDVQGFEKQVIAGGIEVFSKAKLLFLELSFQELYEGQPFFDDIYKMLIPLGFRFYGNFSLMKHPKTGIPLDGDCVFVNENI